MEQIYWIIKKDFWGSDDYTCSKCGWGFIGEPENCLDARDFNYCPNCGGKINGIKKSKFIRHKAIFEKRTQKR